MKFPFVAREALEAAEQKHAELNQEYQNFRRRNASVQETSYFQGGSDALKAMLPIYDNLKLALEQPCEDEAFRTGIEMTLKELEKTFSRLDVHEIPALDAAFDPALHEAVEHIEDPELGENTVVRVIRAGFTRGDTVLRHALVTVAN